MKKKYLFSRYLIILILVVPYLLTKFTGLQEPYPAIILPAGGGTINSFHNGNIIAKEYEIYVFLQSGKVKKIEFNNFLKPLPGTRIIRLIERNFGLSDKTVKSGFTSQSNANVNPGFPEKQRDSVRQDGISWFRNYLSSTYNLNRDDIIKLNVLLCTMHKDLNNIERVVRKQCSIYSSIQLI